MTVGEDEIEEANRRHDALQHSVAMDWTARYSAVNWVRFNGIKNRRGT